MLVAVLVIIYRGGEHVTLHENEERAWSELMRFIDNRWSSHFGPGVFDIPPGEDERARLFFATEGDSYILGKADVSEIEALVSSVIHSERS